jgi:hypothetical protein
LNLLPTIKAVEACIAVGVELKERVNVGGVAFTAIARHCSTTIINTMAYLLKVELVFIFLVFECFRNIFQKSSTGVSVCLNLDGS